MPDALELPDNRDAPSPTLRDVLLVLFRQGRFIAITFSVVFVVVFGYGLMSRSYESHLKVMVRRGRVDPVVTAQASPPVAYNRDEIPEAALNTEAELIRDDDLLRQVVLATNLHNRGGLFSSWRQRDLEKRVAEAAGKLARALKVEPVRKTNLINVRYASGDPQVAAAVLRELAKGYVEKHTQAQRPSGESTFFAQQTMGFESRLQRAESELSEFTRSTGVVQGAVQRDIALQRLGDTQAADRQLRLSVAETEERLHLLESRAPELPLRTTTQVRTGDNFQLLEKLKSRLLELELKRAELLTRYRPTYPLVIEVERQLELAHAAIAAEHLTPVREETTEKDPNREWVESEREKARVELGGLRVRNGLSARQVAQSLVEARGLADYAIRQEALVRNRKVAEDNYLLYLRKREEARIADELDAQGILNVFIAEPPVVPAIPERSLAVFAAIALLAGAILGLVLGFARDYLDPAFRTPEEVMECMETPVLASFSRRAA